MQSDNMNSPKDRKNEEQKWNEAADNAGLFAGNDEDANAARKQATATTTADDTRPRINMDNDIDAGEAQNVTDGAGRLEGKEAEEARNKAMEGMRQGRDDSQRSRNNDNNRNDNDEYGKD